MNAFSLCLTCVLFVACAAPALANNPPGPQAMAAIALLPLSVVLFSLIGGAYYIFCRIEHPRTGAWLVTVIVTALLIILSVIPEIALVTIPVFAWRAVSRSIQMIDWALKLNKGKAELEGASRPRLILGGTGLLLVCAMLVCTSLVFLCPWRYRYNDDRIVEWFAKYQLSYGSEHKHTNGHPYYDHLTPSPDGKWQGKYNGWNIRTGSYKVEYGKKDESFTLLVMPHSLPPFPFNLLDRMPSFRVDQTGKIRMVLVHNNGEECPADAPVVHTIDSSDLRDDDYSSSFDHWQERWNRRQYWVNGQSRW